jgi:hypothetical protein
MKCDCRLHAKCGCHGTSGGVGIVFSLRPPKESTMNDEHDDHEPAPEPAPEPAAPHELSVAERSLSGTIGALALGAGVGFTGQIGALAAQDAYETIKDAFTSSDEESPIILPPGVSGDDE